MCARATVPRSRTPVRIWAMHAPQCDATEVNRRTFRYCTLLVSPTPTRGHGRRWRLSQTASCTIRPRGGRRRRRVQRRRRSTPRTSSSGSCPGGRRRPRAARKSRARSSSTPLQACLISTSSGSGQINTSRCGCRAASAVTRPKSSPTTISAATLSSTSTMPRSRRWASSQSATALASSTRSSNCAQNATPRNLSHPARPESRSQTPPRRQHRTSCFRSQVSAGPTPSVARARPARRRSLSSRPLRAQTLSSCVPQVLHLAQLLAPLALRTRTARLCRMQDPIYRRCLRFPDRNRLHRLPPAGLPPRRRSNSARRTWACRRSQPQVAPARLRPSPHPRLPTPHNHFLLPLRLRPQRQVMGGRAMVGMGFLPIRARTERALPTKLAINAPNSARGQPRLDIKRAARSPDPAEPLAIPMPCRV